MISVFLYLVAVLSAIAFFNRCHTEEETRRRLERIRNHPVICQWDEWVAYCNSVAFPLILK